ncbi:hypothetical protein C2E21_1938 isoform B [Chlorella sorokiniana]|uniref:Uncharacterized protein n=1 Tax=Chlorella sorokiniana TaxID=3076 RepID=A0A2P6U0N9_CHLSO|nr:hypothetical protein C2E21_1938 isoform B [Chlorella sorokiniana]|eukprot:PRW59879.1 hypothetical protein C2E21_1938 isoform B [Chlorella sorokiniana]
MVAPPPAGGPKPTNKRPNEDFEPEAAAADQGAEANLAVEAVASPNKTAKQPALPQPAAAAQPSGFSHVSQPSMPSPASRYGYLLPEALQRRLQELRATQSGAQQPASAAAVPAQAPPSTGGVQQQQQPPYAPQHFAPGRIAADPFGQPATWAAVPASAPSASAAAPARVPAAQPAAVFAAPVSQPSARPAQPPAARSLNLGGASTSQWSAGQAALPIQHAAPAVVSRPAAVQGPHVAPGLHPFLAGGSSSNGSGSVPACAAPRAASRALAAAAAVSPFKKGQWSKHTKAVAAPLSSLDDLGPDGGSVQLIGRSQKGLRACMRILQRWRVGVVVEVIEEEGLLAFLLYIPAAAAHLALQLKDDAAVLKQTDVFAAVGKLQTALQDYRPAADLCRGLVDNDASKYLAARPDAIDKPLSVLASATAEELAWLGTPPTVKWQAYVPASRE